MHSVWQTPIPSQTSTPWGQPEEASSRHAVGHGAATQESYTMTRALQVILTLDQRAFYT
jgi:hypothetical protein